MADTADVVEKLIALLKAEEPNAEARVHAALSLAAITAVEAKEPAAEVAKRLADGVTVIERALRKRGVTIEDQMKKR